MIDHLNRVRIGVVGAGWVAENRHLPALTACKQVQVTTVWSRDLERAHQVARKFAVPTVADDWRRMIDSDEVDAIVVATPPSMHAEVSIAALEAGKHVLCQGRMARNLLEARSMVAAAHSAGLVAGLYPPLPGLKGDRTMARLLREGYIGTIREVRVTSLTFSESHSWANDVGVVGVNAMTLGMWAEVMHRWVGPAAEIAATAAIHDGEGGIRPKIGVPNSISVAGRLESGATLSCHFSTAAANGPGNSIQVFGSKGTLCYRLFKEEMLGGTTGDAGLAEIGIPPDEERLQTTDVEFVEAILKGTTVSPGFDEGALYMGFCEAVAASSATAMRIDLPMREPVMKSWGKLLSDLGSDVKV